MQILANENFPLTSIKVLRSAGFNIKSIGIDYSGILDSEVIKIAIDEQRIILTFDRDYGELIFKKGYKPEAGVIYFRWESFQPEEPGEYLINLFSTKMKFSGKLTVISETNIRQRGFRQQ
jgi:predicted nuclease of predicted toxin-antitoxin system